MRNGVCTCCATTCGLTKMPDPMMPPITIIVASNGPSRRASPWLTASLSRLVIGGRRAFAAGLRVPVFGDELDGDGLAVGGRARAAVQAVGDEHVVGVLARATVEATGLDGRGVRDEADAVQVFGAQPQSARGRLDAEHDAACVGALYLGQPAADLRALEAESLVLRPAPHGDVAGLRRASGGLRARRLFCAPSLQLGLPSARVDAHDERRGLLAQM